MWCLYYAFRNNLLFLSWEIFNFHCALDIDYWVLSSTCYRTVYSGDDNTIGPYFNEKVQEMRLTLRLRSSDWDSGHMKNFFLIYFKHKFILPKIWKNSFEFFKFQEALCNNANETDFSFIYYYFQLSILNPPFLIL